jgi:hypothetical protein
MCTESIVQELNFPNSSVEDVQLKIETIRISYTAELSKAIKSREKWFKSTRILLCQNCFGSNKRIIPVWLLYSTNFSVK